MKKLWTKLGATLLALALLASSFSGCGETKTTSSGASDSAKESSSTSASEKEVAEEENADPVTITSLLAVGTMPAEENMVLQEIRDRTGINLQVTLVSQADYENRKATLAASRNLPDLIGYLGRSELRDMVNNGIAIPLDDLLESYGQEILENKGDLMEGNKIDGVTYAVPYGGTEAAVPSMMAVRQDWLDKLNLSVPETVDEFYEVMKAFTQQDPDGDGAQDTLGFGMGPNNLRDGIFQAYGIAVKSALEVENIVDVADVQAMLEKAGIDSSLVSQITDSAVDGKLLVPEILHPQYLEAVEYMHRLYAEGLMEPDFATIPWMQCLEKLWNGTYGAFDFSPVGTTNNWASRYTESPAPTFTYTILKTEYSDGGVLASPIDSSGVCVNSQCEHPEAAIEILNFLCSEEGNDLAILGIEGVHYKDNGDGTVSYLPPYDENLEQQRTEGGFVYNSLMDRMGSATLKTFNQVTTDAIEMGMEHQLADSVFLVDSPEILVETGSILTDMLDEAFSSLVVTNGNIEEEYGSYLERFCRSGGVDWVKQATEIYYQN